MNDHMVTTKGPRYMPSRIFAELDDEKQERILEAAGDRQRTEEMGRAAKALGKTDTASVIYDRIKELIG